MITRLMKTNLYPKIYIVSEEQRNEIDAKAKELGVDRGDYLEYDHTRVVEIREILNEIAKKYRMQSTRPVKPVKVLGTWQARPVPTLDQMKSFALALIFGKYESDQMIEERSKICQQCDKLRFDGDGSWCGVCGCGVKETKEIRNLAAYKENLPLWGCKHPQRQQGRGWPMTDEVKKFYEENSKVKE